jgi:single-stranded-DNA-specific exonuclease
VTFEYQTRGSIGIGNPVTKILENRGIKNVPMFLNPTKSCLEDNHLLDNIDLAVDIFLKHMNNNSKVVVLQDCDCDGVTSAALMIQYINENFPSILVDCIIHDNKEHGLDDKSMLKIEQKKPDLLIIPDAGSNDLRQLKTLKSAGIDVVVLDHHDESEKVTRLKSIYKLENLNDFAVIVNNQMSSKVKDKSMTGVGIVYKFCSVVDERLKRDTVNKYLDLVALGMIADSCDLTQLQTRYLVLEGIKQIQNETNHNKFISELVKSQAYSLHSKATILGISFYIAPLVNALIRLGTKDGKEIMLKAFLNSSEKAIVKIRGKGEIEVSIQEQARRLCESYKRKQQKITSDYTEVLKEQINEFGLNEYPVICCKADKSFEKTFTGLIANKLTSMYNKPCLLLRDCNDILMGSARGFDKSHIKDIKDFCLQTKLFDLAEGHPNACGVTIKKDNISKFYEYLSQQNFDNTLNYTVDAVFDEKSLTAEVIQSIFALSDVWGTNIEEPLFLLKLKCPIDGGFTVLGNEKNTIKLTFHNIEIIKFRSSENEYNEIKNLGKMVEFTIVGKFSVNEYNGKKTPQVIVENWMYKPCDEKPKFRF